MVAKSVSSKNEKQSDLARACLEFRGWSSQKTQPSRLSIFGHRAGWSSGKTMVGGGIDIGQSASKVYAFCKVIGSKLVCR